MSKSILKYTKKYAKKYTGKCISGVMAVLITCSVAVTPIFAETKTAAGSTALNSTSVSASSATEDNLSWPDAPDVTCESAILIDADTGSILYEKDSTRKCYPASTTKILTGLLTIENCNMNDIVTFSSKAANSINPSEDANLGTKTGEKYTVEQALYALLLYSANEVAYGLAEQVAGSLDAFVEMMNNKAKELGALNTHFANASGLYDPNHYTTAYDMAMIARGCYNNSSFVNIDSTYTSYTIPATNVTSSPRTFRHRHKMLKNREYYYEYCKGGKTGFTDESLYTLVTFAEKDGMRLICVVFRSPDDATRFIDTRALFDWGFNNFKKSTTNNTNISSLYTTDNYYSSDVFSKMKLDFDLGASFITIPNSGSTSNVTMDINEDYEITNSNGKLTAQLDFLYGKNKVGSTKLTISSDGNKGISSLPYSDTETNVSHPSPKRCIEINVWIIVAAGAGILIVINVIDNIKMSKKRNRHYSRRRIKF